MYIYLFFITVALIFKKKSSHKKTNSARQHIACLFVTNSTSNIVEFIKRTLCILLKLKNSTKAEK